MMIMSFLFVLVSGTVEIDPSVRWLFSFPSTSNSNMVNFEIMSDFFRPIDEVYIYFDDGQKENAHELRKKVKSTFKNSKVTLIYDVDRSKFLNSVGFLIADPISGEWMGYRASGIYNQNRSISFMSIYRNPNSQRITP